MIPLTPHLLDYAVNTLWQLPLLAASTWLLIRLCRPSTAVQHCLWIATLVLAATLPLHGYTTTVPVSSIPVSNISVSNFSVPHSSPASSSRTGSTVLPQPASARSQLLAPHHIPLNATLLTNLVRLWLLALAINLIRLAHAWFTSRRLIARAYREDHALDPDFLHTCAARLAIPVPEIRYLPVSEAEPNPSPVVAGIFRPILLLPTHIAHDYELTAVLLHEFAHIRRRDTLTNLLCRVIALPIAWHPVTPLLHTRINQTREILCDALAAQASGSSTAYARSLLTLARSLNAPSQPSPVTLGLFPSTRTSTPLEERIMKLIAPAAPQLSHRAVRISTGVALVAAATLTAAAFHLQAASAAERHTPTAPLITAYSRTPTTNWHPEPSTSQKPSAAHTSTDNGATWQSTPLPQAPAAPPTLPTAPISPPPAVAPFAALPALPPLPATPSLDPTAPLPPLPDQHSLDPSAPLPQMLTPPPVAPAMPQGLPAPVLSPAPAPASAPMPPPKPTHHSRIIIDGKDRPLTPAEQADLDKQLANINIQVNSALGKHLLDEQQLKIQLKNLNIPDLNRQMADLRKQMNSPKFQKQLAEATKLATDRAMNSEELRRQLDDAAQQIKIAQAQIAREHINIQIDSAKVQAQIKAATDAVAHTKFDIHIDTPEIQRQLDQAQKQIDEARKRVQETAPKQ